LSTIALRVDELLLEPANMAAARAWVECYLAGRVQGTIDPIRFPIDPQDEYDVPDESRDALTPEQVAAALVALHDVLCDGVDKVISIPSELPPIDPTAPNAEMLNRNQIRAVS